MSPTRPSSSFESGVFPPWTRLPDRRGKGQTLTPIVTIFGAGIAGLSAAHELIERGFSVQVVESSARPDEEYSVEVGGMASNQFGRVPENPDVLHGPEPTGNEEKLTRYRDQIERVLLLRSARMRRVQRRYATPWRILFERPTQHDAEDPHAEKMDSSGAIAEERANSAAHPLRLDKKDDWGVKNRTKLVSAWETFKEAYLRYREDVMQLSIASQWEAETDLDDDFMAREILCVEIRGHTDGDGEEGANRRRSKEWAESVRDYFKTLDDGVIKGGLDHHFRCLGIGSAEPLGDPRDEASRQRSNRVEFRIVEQLIPGEHGYRFFPAFYRHLFDTMRRTPMLDDHDRETGQTAFDRLVPTMDVGIAPNDGQAPASMQTRRIKSLEELRRLWELFLGRLGVTHRDIARFQVRMLKFLTSSSARRHREYEDRSWWTFIGGDMERGYSEKMRKFLLETPQALVAMNAEETDARSQGNIVCQLQLKYLEDEFDRTLNGPTTQAWLREWKRYLKRQGVRFFVGELGMLEWRGGDLVPVTTHESAFLTPAAEPPKPKEAPADGPDRGVRERPAPPVARPEQPAVQIEVLDAHDGDYTIFVNSRPYCYASTGKTREEIAAQLVGLLAAERAVSANVKDSRITLSEKREVRLPALGQNVEFDDSPVPGSWQPGFVRRIDRDGLEDPAAFAEELRVWFSAQRTRDDVGFVASRLKDREWTALGRLRASEAEFAKLAQEFETRCRPRRELVPRIEIDDQRRAANEEREIILTAPEWVEKVGRAEGKRPRNFAPVFPYYFRTLGDAERSNVIWISVSNVHRNLKIIGEPIAENPAHDYRSHRESKIAFQPDFYVLALPFEDASRLVWRAERANRGGLDGCLSEVLEFDRQTLRRDSKGDELPLVRNPVGRPPAQYPLRDFSGIQYYFHNHVRIGKGHIYFPDAEWGLSSISQLAYWRERLSPDNVFMGQLSVDIGNFYEPAPPRRGGREQRTAWQSTFPEIANEVWHQVKRGLERQHAGMLTAPDYVHLDDGLQFNDPRGSSFREIVSIVVKNAAGDYSVRINGDAVTLKGDGGDDRTMAEKLRTAICSEYEWIEGVVEIRSARRDISKDVMFGTTRQSVRLIRSARLDELDELEEFEQSKHGQHRAAVTQAIHKRRLKLTEDADSAKATADEESLVVLRLRSKVPPRGALAMIRASNPGTYELTIAGRRYTHAQMPYEGERPARNEPNAKVRRGIRDALFARLVSDPDLPIIVEPSGNAGLILAPRGNDALPEVSVRNDNQNISLVFGPSLHVRLEHCGGGLRFADRQEATVGYNRTPFLINVPGQWRYRPGVDRETPMRNSPISYGVSNRRWVAAGTYMATTTRLTTMEAANESARHAVKAILERLVQPGPDYNSQGRLFADPPEIFDPEQHELDDLVTLKALDARLADEGLPHVLDILKVIDSVDSLPMHGQPSPDPFANLLHVLQHATEISDRDWAFLKETFTGLMTQAAERVHDHLDPFGLLRGLKGDSGELSERIRSMIRAFLDRSTGQPPPGTPRGPGT